MSSESNKIKLIAHNPIMAIAMKTPLVDSLVNFIGRLGGCSNEITLFLHVAGEKSTKYSHGE